MSWKVRVGGGQSVCCFSGRWRWLFGFILPLVRHVFFWRWKVDFWLRMSINFWSFFFGHLLVPLFSILIYYLRHSSRSCGKNYKGWLVYLQRTLETRENMPKSKRERRSNNASGYTGVSLTKSKRYQAKIKVDGKWDNIGTYDTAKQAAKAYDAAAIELGRPLSK